MNILGISAFYHDSAACLIIDGNIVAAAQEERFSRKKHDFRFPSEAIQYCLIEAGIEAKDLDYVAFYDKPFLKFERILETYLQYAPWGLPSFLKAIPLWIKKKLWMKDLIRKELKGYKGEILFPEHHESHAASAFYPSPFDKAAFITIDGVGEWTTTSFGTGNKNKLKIISDIKFPHSLGLLYSAFTYYTGFKVNSGEYKLMGLAPYGAPKYKKLILDELIDLKKDGSFSLNMKYFDYAVGLKMTSKEFDQLFGGPPRAPESELTQKEMDLARSIQEVAEDVVLKMAKHVRKITKMNYLCLAGGVALNCVVNGKLIREKIFKDIWIQPAAGDAGGALGAALAVWYQYLGKPREDPRGKDPMNGAYLGPSFSDDFIEQYLNIHDLPYIKIPKHQIPQITAKLIGDQNVIGWFQGRMEFGPRALGSRSIIGDARSAEMQKIMNLKIKFRESFRPFAPSVIYEGANKFFDLDRPSPYMLVVADVKKNKLNRLPEKSKKLEGLKKLDIPRSKIPAVTHVDNSARIQTVHKDTNPLYHAMIKQFDKKYKCPVIINTSFNVRGEPIVCSPEDAYLCFMRTNMDYLMMGNFLLDKREQPSLTEDVDWRDEFELD